SSDLKAIGEAKIIGYESLKIRHNLAWENIWANSQVECGQEYAQQALNYSLYHLHSIAPRHSGSMSIPARGLSGQTYKGAVFWDTEIFMFPFFVHTEPKVARALISYRIETLTGALKKAREYGLRGAFYAWESQEGGTEGCTDYNVTDVFTGRPVRTYFRDKQIHISGDIAYAIGNYYDMTGDDSILLNGGAEVVFECARFYLSRAYQNIDTGAAEFLDVVGPDEYHERVNNNAFTNRLAKYCFDKAIEYSNYLSGKYPTEYSGLFHRLSYGADLEKIKSIAGLVYKPNIVNEVIEQFDGYFKLEACSLQTVRSRLLDPREYWGSSNGVAAHTQIIKQADVISMMHLFSGDFSEAEVRANWEYYEPRTEHGSSLSACMYALTACRVGRPDLAYEFFMKSATIDLTGEGKDWAGEVYIGGTHPAANGGAWLIAALGFAGLKVKNGVISLNPCLPKELAYLRFPVNIAGKKYIINIEEGSHSVTPV
ncbi:MAG: glycoside hydrolase family 65 protein, partial [Clostridiales bacterium]|nr:glycoside hydrolase family 65 protein [Clostridiales bacterium]